jgi:carbon starvation protein
MNTVVIFLCVLLWFILGYIIYGRFIERKIAKPSNSKTPAHRFKGIDYKPSKKLFLFGHHFASIAGAGPIIGPILAVSYFGWFFVVLWISVGSLLIGGIHDYLSLILSVKHNGDGIAKVSRKITGNRTFYVFSALLWLTLMLIITVFSVSSAESLVSVPELVIPFFGMTLTAVIIGLGVYKYKMGKIGASLLGIVLVVFFIWLGLKFPMALPFSAQTATIIWISILFLYALVVSLVPVWLVLQPRDYLSSVSLFLFLGVGVISVLIAQPIMNAPAFISSNLPLWPILFITVACGAVSGFHSLVASGTTSKQLDKEKDAKPIAYGGMLVEGVVALLVVIFVGAGLKWGAGVGSFSWALDEGWIVAFGQGFSNVVGQAFSFIDGGLLVILGSLIVNIFILTSLDTSTRIGRMISAELFPKKKRRNNFVLTLAILIPAFLIAVTNSYATLWRMFGASNQLIAGIVLIAISAYLVEIKKPVLYTLLPGLFMVVTTVGAILYGLFNPSGYIAQNNVALIVISAILGVFAVIVFVEIICKVCQRRWRLV